MTESEGFPPEPDLIDLGVLPPLPEDAQQVARVTRWRKKPVEVEMIRWDGSDEAARLIEAHGGALRLAHDRHASLERDGTSVRIWVQKSGALMWLALGDWAVLEPDGTGVYPRTAAEQERGYEPAGSASGLVTRVAVELPGGGVIPDLTDAEIDGFTSAIEEGRGMIGVRRADVVTILAAAHRFLRPGAEEAAFACLAAAAGVTSGE